ncbi:hypothetical protein AVEN_47872-1 [Araneus ventricosus]|uniref:Uncharacterized protein n=1 Tax=Araneus ventricosus TaxID=182803 RepID=A0A4Y2UGW3_ARAVE|nr:hypothetical protein AVEN_47872-1 [Araneus ventricosus]
MTCRTSVACATRNEGYYASATEPEFAIRGGQVIQFAPDAKPKRGEEHSRREIATWDMDKICSHLWIQFFLAEISLELPGEQQSICNSSLAVVLSYVNIDL